MPVKKARPGWLQAQLAERKSRLVDLSADRGFSFKDQFFVPESFEASDTLVAVASDTMAKGVAKPRKGVTFDWREPLDSEGNSMRVRASYAVMPLLEALDTQWLQGALFVSCVMFGADGMPLTRQPRLTAAGLPWVREQGFAVKTKVISTDVDNPGHKPWTLEWLEDTLEKIAECELLRTCIIYFTPGGLRVIQVMREWVDVLDGKRITGAWLRELEKAGFAIDWNCTDWTRHYHLPFSKRAVERDRNRPSAPRVIDPVRAAWHGRLAFTENSVSVHFEIPPGLTENTARARKTIPLPDSWVEVLPDTWEDKVAALAAEVSASGPSHPMFLALSGALVTHGGVPSALIPAIIGRVSEIVDSTDRREERKRTATSTLTKMSEGVATTGMRMLRMEWPAVAEAVMDLAAKGRAAALRLDTEEEWLRTAGNDLVICERRDLFYHMKDFFAHPRAGVTGLVAPTGAGKSNALMAVAVERASKLKADGTVPERALAQSKTGIAAKTNELAIQTFHTLQGSGVRVKRLRSPESVLDENGNPVCRFAKTAKLLASGKQSIPLEFCEGRGNSPCPYRSTCGAVGAYEGDDKALIVVSTHAQVGSLDAEIGMTGLLAVDETMDPLENEVFEHRFLSIVTKFLDAFERRFVDALRPALMILVAWTSSADLGVTMDLREIVAKTFRVVSQASLTIARTAARVDPMLGDVDLVLEAVKKAKEKNVRSGPPMLRGCVEQARDSEVYAAQIGRVSSLLHVIYRAATSKAPVKFRVDEARGERMLVATLPNEQFLIALKRDGATVLADASFPLQAQIIKNIIGYDPPYKRLETRDGAYVERIVLHTGSANRKRWWTDDAPIPEHLARALKQALELLGPVKALGLITWKAARGMIERALEPLPKNASAALKREHAELSPVLKRHEGELILGHYGAIRGINSMERCDALITLGDPWQHLPTVENNAAYCGVTDWEKYFYDLTAAELEQAQGRLRVIHRTGVLRALHVGCVRPGGLAWAGKLRVVELAVGRPKNEPAMSKEEFREIVARFKTRAAAVDAFGCSERTIRNYLIGYRAIDTATAGRIREAVSRIATPVTVAVNECTGTKPDTDKNPDPEEEIYSRGFRAASGSVNTASCGVR